MIGVVQYVPSTEGEAVRAILELRDVVGNSAMCEVTKLVCIVFVDVIGQVASVINAKREVVADAVAAGTDAAGICKLCYEERCRVDCSTILEVFIIEISKDLRAVLVEVGIIHNASQWNVFIVTVGFNVPFVVDGIEYESAMLRWLRHCCGKR